MRRMLQGRAGMAAAFLLGLLIATAGTATAAKLITGKQIKDGSISAKDLSKAVRAQLARTSTPGSKGDVGQPGPKGDPGVKGDPSSLPPAEPVHYVGDPGEPGFESNWGSSTVAKTVGFYKDGAGVVHLHGTVNAGAGATPLVFSLPAGYRPTADQSFGAASPFGGSAPAVVDALLVSATGAVQIQLSGSGARQRSLSGVSFRTG